MDQQHNPQSQREACESLRGMLVDGLGFSLLISKPANYMSYHDQALITRLNADDIGAGRVILRRPDEQIDNSSIADFVRHREHDSPTGPNRGLS